MLLLIIWKFQIILILCENFMMIFRHTESMISKLESAGLGYHVNVASTYEKIGESLYIY